MVLWNYSLRSSGGFSSFPRPKHHGIVQEDYRRKIQVSEMVSSRGKKASFEGFLIPHPGSRMSTEKIMKNCWFRKGYEQIETPPSPQGQARSSLIREVHAAFDDESKSKENSTVAPRSPLRPTRYNAFDIISLSEGFDLSGLFEKDKNRRHEARFTTTKPASMIVSKFEQIAMAESFSFKKKDGTLMLEGSREGRKGLLAIDAEICEVTPSFYVVEVKKKSGDSFEYKEFCDHELKPSLEDIVWAWQGCEQPEV
ncbi:hypothetical protein OIU84_002574 [Salix udensis]|uniref:non-specific serine/threonine protein kinase n=1 Tax=Salix udensis TaxID=889485 RepID=A0AAD6P4R7_9ROSI|nr:hypothetical protein OIU84_002574 [Salix udensis]